VSKLPSDRFGLIEFISRSIEESGHCTIRDKRVLGLLWSITDTFEAKIHRLRPFARQNNWTVASHLGHAAVFTRRHKLSDAHLTAVALKRRSGYIE
jgi:hypothetical protein